MSLQDLPKLDEPRPANVNAITALGRDGKRLARFYVDATPEGDAYGERIVRALDALAAQEAKDGAR